MFDRIEAGTYLIAAATSRKISIKNVNSEVLKTEIDIKENWGQITSKNEIQF